jgi:hypothetical protein
MALTKYKMWVEDVSLTDGLLYAEGYKSTEIGGLRSSITLSLDELKESLSKDEFNQMIDMHQANSHSVKILPDLRTGRIFEIHIDNESQEEKIVVPEYKPFTQEELDSAKEHAEKWAKLFEDDSESDSSND